MAAWYLPSCGFLSGVACLILTISPFWMVGVEALLPGGEPLRMRGIAGMLVGLLGASLLFTPDWHANAHHPGKAGLLSGFLILQLAMAGWSFGSIYQRRQVAAAHPIVIGAVQQLAASGLACLPLVLLFREHPVHWSFLRGRGDFLSGDLRLLIVGYSVYIFALDRLPVAVRFDLIPMSIR